MSERLVSQAGRNAALVLAADSLVQSHPFSVHLSQIFSIANVSSPLSAPFFHHLSRCERFPKCAIKKGG